MHPICPSAKRIDGPLPKSKDSRSRTVKLQQKPAMRSFLSRACTGVLPRRQHGTCLGALQTAPCINDHAPLGATKFVELCGQSCAQT